MQGVVTDDKGAYVKAAIVKLIKILDSNEESEPEAVTYAETDEEGRFIFQELNSDEKYIIEIYVDRSESSDKKDEEETKKEIVKIEEPESKYETENDVSDSEPDEEIDDFLDGNGIIDRLKTNNMIDDIVRGSISICNLNYIADLNLKEKPYLTKSNLW